MNAQRRQLLDDNPPPRVRSGPSKPIVILACGGIIAVLLLIVILNIKPHTGRGEVAPDENIIELITPPRPLTAADLEGEQGLGSSIQPLRAERGWIETRRRDGRPAQRYRCESLDPAPEGFGPGWLTMIHPRMELFSDDRIVSIQGDSAFAYAPQRAVEHGTVTGNVVVRVFDIVNGQPVNVDVDEPSIVMRTDEASFENFLGEIRCDNWVVIETPTFRMPGSRLSVLVDDQNNEIRVTMAKVEYIRFTREAEQSKRSVAAPEHQRRIVSASRTRAQRDSTTRLMNPQDDARFYLLTIRDNVRIEEGDRDARRTASGERLEVIFSSKSEVARTPLAGTRSLAPALATLHDASHRYTPQPMPLTTALASMVYASTPPGVRMSRSSTDVEQMMGQGVTLVRCDGPLTIEPLRDSSRALTSPNDARLELTGSTTGVTLCDFGNQSEVTARSLVYHTERDRIELRGSDAYPLRVSTPELEAGGEVFHLAQADGAAGFDGSGWLTRRDRSENEWFALACAVNDPQPVRPRTTSPRLTAPPQPTEEPELHITWEDGVDLQFDPTDEDGKSGKLRSAVFTGKVRVSSTDLTMTSEQMAVRFPADGKADAIESIHATGGVEVLGVIEQASIRCDDLHLDLAQTVDGRTIPKLMVATGDVEAADDEQMIWADRLRVGFRESTESASDTDGRLRGAQVDEFIAERNVQVMLADGTRVFAEELTGDGINEIVDLTGPNVAVVSDRMIVDQGTRITLNRKEGTASVPGAGQFRLYQNSILPTPREDVHRDTPPKRIDRPAVDEDVNPMELRARWRRSLVYNSTTNHGAGSVDLHGDVSVVSNPSPLEHNTMTGEALVLEFAFADAATETPAVPGLDIGSQSSSSRELSLLIARQDAKIESQTWETLEERREIDPRIFYVAGQHVEYNPRTGEALVVGNGELLIHDARADADPHADAPFGSKGSTMLTWDGRLHLERRADEVFDLSASRNVRLRHRDLQGAISTLMCDELNATALRGATERRGDLDFGGSAQLQRVNGSGAVEIRTDQRTVHCGEFDYDVTAGVAQMKAAANREITIQTAGSPMPLHAQAAIWNMHRDTINITRGRGGLRR